MQSFVLLAVMGGALYAFIILPQQKRVKAHQALLRSLTEGDIVVTNAGIYGAVAEVEDDVIWLEVAPDVELKISKAAIAERVADDEVADDEVDADDDDDDGDGADDTELIDVDTDDSDA
ncbi:MAG: preprotein translocase subunit YajC [Candidatus Aldehydirespiratoraceae bacterium]|jgi:preprotein translocase subunit YajC